MASGIVFIRDSNGTVGRGCAKIDNSPHGWNTAPHAGDLEEAGGRAGNNSLALYECHPFELKALRHVRRR